MYKCLCKWENSLFLFRDEKKPLPIGWKLSKENIKQKVRERDFNRSLEIQSEELTGESMGELTRSKLRKEARVGKKWLNATWMNFFDPVVYPRFSISINDDDASY